VATNGAMAAPALAPRTNGIAMAGGTTPAPTRPATVRMMAMDECDSQVRSAASAAVKTMSFSSAERTTARAGESRSGSEEPTTRRSASMIRPTPISARPICRRLAVWLMEKRAKPVMTATGDSQRRSMARSWAATAVPTSAPSITARAAARPIIRRSAKAPVMIAVAVELCSGTVMKRPAAAALKRLPAARRSTLRKDEPSARLTPVRTMRTPQSKRAMPPTSSIRMRVALNRRNSDGRGSGNRLL
jgi:hypothetical protein